MASTHEKGLCFCTKHKKLLALPKFPAEVLKAGWKAANTDAWLAILKARDFRGLFC